MSIAFSFDSFNLMRARPVRVTKKYPVFTQVSTNCYCSMLQSDMLLWKPDKGVCIIVLQQEEELISELGVLVKVVALFMVSCVVKTLHSQITFLRCLSERIACTALQS